jgi:hypothetical protein
MSSQPPKRQKTGANKKKRERKSTQLCNKLKLEGPPRKADTGKLVDRDDRLPQEASELNLLADTFWNAGCRTMEEIAADEQAAASPAEHHNPLAQDPPRHPFDIKVTYEHNHNHNIHASPSSPLSAEDISRNVRAMERFNVPGRSMKAVARPGEEGEAHETATIPALGLRCTVAEIPAPPPLSYTAENIGDLIRDWDSGARLQIGGIHVPLKYWPDLYARCRGDIFAKRKEVWRQWRVSKSSSWKSRVIEDPS